MKSKIESFEVTKGGKSGDLLSEIHQDEKPVRQYFENLMHQGFSHHSIAAPGKVGKQLECLARQLEIDVCWL